MKHLFWIAGFIALTLAFDRLSGLYLQKLVQTSHFRYSRLYRHQGATAQVLLLGNSRGLAFYQPEIEALTHQETLNLSYNGMPADLGRVLVTDQIQQNGKPKVLVIDITMCNRTDAALVQGFNLYAPFSDSLRALIHAYHPNTKRASAVSHVYRYNSELFQRALFYQKKSDESWLLDRVISPQLANDTALTAYRLDVHPGMINQLKLLVKYAQAQDVSVRLVINPYFPRYGASIRRSFIEPLKSMATAATGLPVHDYSLAITETTDFGDYQHLNKKGAIRYMKLLAREHIFTADAKNTTADATPPVVYEK